MEESKEQKMKKNPISANWVHLPKVSEVQACYVFYDALISLWDKYWISLKNEEREVPLSNSEAQEDGVTYLHSQLKFETLKPSNILKHPNLLATLQMLVREIIEDNPSFLLN